MYRCTECHAEYQNLPDFCDCGNDTFEEYIEEEEYYEEEPPKPRKKPKKRQLSEEEIEEIRAEKADKKKAMITIGISLFISIVILCLPPYPAKKIEKVQQRAAEANVKFPDVSSYWKSDKLANKQLRKQEAKLPILNERFSNGTMDGELRQYLIGIGKDFNQKWDKSLVQGSGECKAQFTVNKDGILGNQSIYAKSRNNSLDDSVLLLLTDLKNVDMPPKSYRGERIIIAFSVDENKTSKIYYPTK